MMSRSTIAAHRILGLMMFSACACSEASVADKESAPLLAAQLAQAAPSADREVIALATQALACVRSHPSSAPARTLSVIDYSRPSTEPRLWVFDLADETLLFEERVAHGRNSGGNIAAAFSDTPGSLMSSIGTFVTADTYTGHNGYSLRLVGLEPGFNDRAFDRAIVIHGAPYVSDGLIRSQGRLGRSFGCPAVRTEVARSLIDKIRGGSLLFAYYPDDRWLHTSKILNDCGSADAGNALVGNVVAR